MSCVSRTARVRSACLWLAIVTLLATVAAQAKPAGAAVTPTKDALAVAHAIADHPAFVASAGFMTAPPLGHTAAVLTDMLAGFWTSRETSDFAILATGDLGTLVTEDATSQIARASDDLGGGAVRGGSERDVTTLRIELRVPTGASCLRFDYRFLSEEWPEYASNGQPGLSFNDAFIAELGTSDWLTKDDQVIAERTFATTFRGEPVTVSTSGPFMTSQNAFGTTYDGAGPIRQAWTPVEPGLRTLYLSIFDSADGEQDSAVLIDHLTYGTNETEFCAEGPTLVTQSFANAPRSLVGRTNGYRVLIEAVGSGLDQIDDTLSAPVAVKLIESITNLLAPGFAYVPGSTTSATTSEPSAEADGLLTWKGPFAKDQDDAVELRFGVTVAEKPGTYRNTATAQAEGYFLLPVPGGAPIDVVAASADLAVSYTQTPSPAVLGEQLTIALVASNGGPQPAANVVLKSVLPEALAKVAVTTTQGACDLSAGLTCKLGTISAGGEVRVTVTGVLASVAGVSFGASAHGTELDEDPANNVLGVDAALLALGVGPIKPVVGETVATKTKSGKIKVRRPDAEEFAAIDEVTEIPVGTTIDARKGRVTITSAIDETGTAQAASFSGAKFVVSQSKQSGLTTLRLVGGNFTQCRPKAKTSQADRTTQRFIKDGARGRRVIRSMWGRGKGKFRTRGRYASATVRGTVWRTVDRCDGTLIRVKRGVVVVRDVNRNRAVAVKAGQRYLITKPKVGKKPA